MPSLAATATAHSSGPPLLLLITAAITVCYLVGCWIWPFTACRRCHGGGKRRSPFGGGRTFGICRKCDGTGRQLRAGRHVLNHLRDRRSRGGRTAHRKDKP